MTRDEFKVVIRALARGCRIKFEHEELEIWFALLCDLPADAAAVAVARFVCEVGKWPDIATIRRFADEAANGSAKPWSDALAEVRQAIRRHGFYGRDKALESLDDVTRETVKALGGWAKLCDWPIDSAAAFNAQFRDAYSARTEAIQRRRCLPLEVRPALPGEAVPTNWLSRAANVLRSVSDAFPRLFHSRGEA